MTEEILEVEEEIYGIIPVIDKKGTLLFNIDDPKFINEKEYISSITKLITQKIKFKFDSWCFSDDGKYIIIK